MTTRAGEAQPGSLRLAAAEDRHDRAEWEAAAAAVLRKSGRLGEDDPDALVWEKLTRKTLDGIGITPLGTPDLLDGLTTAGRPNRAGAWDVRAHLAVSDAAVTDVASANQVLIADLEGGVNSLWLEVGAEVDWAALLDQVLLDLAPVVLSTDEAGARAFLAYAEGRELHPRTTLGLPAAAATAEQAELARRAAVLGFVVDATAVHDRGASEAQELASSLKAGADYLRALNAAGLSVEAAARLVEFRYAATDEQFTTIAKLRAARRLWARVLELSGAPGVDQLQHVVTSRPMMSKYDPWVNMLRTTVAAFAAGVGGADAVTVLPFDTPLGVPDAFGRRIARNTSHLLIEESHLGVVADPSGGAYAVEKLTDDLALAAWELFGRLEEGSDLDAEIAAAVQQRDREVATRKRPITGLSEFPALGEQLPERAPAPDLVRRYGAAFEALRDEPMAEHVFLATLGPVAAHTARATFATNLLAAGGVALDAAGATETVDDLLAAYQGQRVVCLAGHDRTYEEWGDEAAARLREAGAQWVVIAGRPRDSVDDSIAAGGDALAFLHRIREKLA